MKGRCVCLGPDHSLRLVLMQAAMQLQIGAFS